MRIWEFLYKEKGIKEKDLQVQRSRQTAFH